MSDSQELLSLKDDVEWMTLVSDDCVHVVPVYFDGCIADDHVLTACCQCQPVRMVGIGRILFSHRRLSA